MRKIWHITVGVLLMLVAGFCIFGFLASFEPGIDLFHVFKAVYGIIGIGSLLGAGWLFFPG